MTNDSSVKDADETVQELQDVLDEIKRLWQQGEYLDLPGPIERARALADDLGKDDTNAPVSHGCQGSVLVDEMVDYDMIHSRIREDATDRFSPLPNGTRVDPADWEIEYWLIEDNCVYYRVSHPDSPVKSEVVEFAV